MLSAECTYNSVGNNIWKKMTNIFLEKMLNYVRNSLVAAVVGLAFQAFRLAEVSEICPIRASFGNSHA